MKNVKQFITKNKKIIEMIPLFIQISFFVTSIIIFDKFNTANTSSTVLNQFYLTTFCVLMLIIMYASLIKSSTNDHATSIFKALIFIDSIHLSLDAQTWLIDKTPGIRMAMVILNMVYYLCPPILSWLIWKFLGLYCKKDKSFINSNKLVDFFTILGLLLIVFNLKYGYYYTISVDGCYSRSKTYALSLVTIAIVMILFVATVIKQETPLKIKLIFLSYPIVPYAGSIITASANGPTLMPSLMFISLFFIYSNIYVYREEEIAQEKAKFAQKQAELDTAADIQAKMLPNVFPPFPNKTEFDIYATMDPAREVGGDFYDFFLLDDDHLAIVIGDVSGKGVPASLFMVIAKTLIKNQSQLGLSPADIFTRVNAMLCDGNDTGLFVTAWMGIIDLKDNKLTYVCAGHNPPLIRRNNGEYEWIKGKKGFVLAGLDTSKYQENEMYLTDNDIIFLYTDGVTEATDKNNKLYGEDRLINWMNAHHELSSKDILINLKADIDQFVGDTEQFDDITMLCVKLTKH